MEIFPELPLALAMTVPFLVTLVALYVIVFRPLLSYLDQREQVRERAIAEARALEEQIEERVNDLNQRLEAARSEMIALRAAEREKALAAEGALLAEARAAAEAKVAEAVAAISASKAEAHKTLQNTASSLAAEIAAQVLGRQIQA